MKRPVFWFFIFFLNFAAAVCALEEPSLTTHYVAGVSFKVPTLWKRQSPLTSTKRIQYEITPPEGEKIPGIFSVLYYGWGEAETSPATVAKWRSEFSEPPLGFEPEIYGGSVDDLKISTLWFEGTYRDPDEKEGKPQKGFAMLGAIIEGPEGPVFFKLVGPRATVLSAHPAFDTLIRSIHKSELKPEKRKKKRKRFN